MFGRRKGFTAAQSKVTSRRMRSATLGTHVPRQDRSRRTDPNASSVNFSNARKSRRAVRGVVENVTPSSSSGESARDHSRRVGHRQFVEEIQRKARVRRIVLVAAIALAVLCVAVCVGALAFLGSVDGKLSLDDSNASTALVAQPEADPYYLLCVADLGTGQASSGISGLSAASASAETLSASSSSTSSAASMEPDAWAYLLVRVDEQAQTATAIALPADLRVRLSDGELHALSDAVQMGGDAALIEAVSSFAGVDIAHFAKTDASGIAHVVDAVGGVSMQVGEEVDDPAAGDVYLASGQQALDGAAALTLLRAGNYAGGEQSKAENRTALFFALANKLMEERGWGLFTRLDQVAADVQTDWKTLDLMSLADALRSLSVTYAACVPGYETQEGGQSLFAASDSEWVAMMERVRAGEDPAIPEEEAPDVDPTSFTVAVRNGTDVTGSAAQLTEILEAQGFKITETGNVDDYTIYPETLVVYHDEVYAPAAEAIVAASGAGRVISGGSYYVFDADVLVIIGTDYQPIV